MNYIGYYRVSTEDQGTSGLGLRAQQDYVKQFAVTNGKLLSEYTDVETGTKNSREGLKRAILECKLNNATLVAYDISRISRGGYSMMASLEEADVDFIEALSPNDSKFSKGIKFMVAKEEAERISRNTKKALQVIKDKIARGETHISKSGNIVTKLGSSTGLPDHAIEKSKAVRKKIALEDPNNRKAGMLITTMKDNGASFYKICKELNNAGFKTSRGNNFSQPQVKRLYERYTTTK